MKPLAQRRPGSWGPRTEEPGTASEEAALHEWELEWAEAATADQLEARRAHQPTARGRLGVLTPAAVLSAVAPTVLWWTPGFSAGHTMAAIFACVVAALIAISIVPLANRLANPPAGSGAGDQLLFTAALASAGAAAIHFLVIGMHFDEYTLYGVFFVVSAIAQLVWAVWLLLRPWPPLLVLGALGNAAIVALWIADRVGAVPIGPDATEPPPFGLGDGMASGFEILLVVCCIAALRRGRRRRLTHGTSVALTLSAVALTTLGFLSVLAVASSVLPPAM
jgi:hypothetical protein